MLDKAFGAVNKAKNADTIVFTLSRFEEFPDLWVSDTNFTDMKKVSAVGAQQNAFVWGKSELIDYINADGKKLRAILTKPDNFDPAKKYPLMVYIYEELTQGLHSFAAPNVSTSINIPRYVSNGYVLLRPDIVYTTGYPGEAAEKCVIPAVNTRRRAGLHRSEADRHPGALVGRLPDRAPDHAHESLRGGRKRARPCRT